MELRQINKLVFFPKETHQHVLVTELQLRKQQELRLQQEGIVASD